MKNKTNNKTACVTAMLALTASMGAMAEDLTIVSWGGAYSLAQEKSYHIPYQEKTGINIIQDESAAESVAKLRAMNEADNVSWDVVDAVASDAIRLCDEGLAIEINHAELLAPAPDGTSVEKDFGDFIISECFIPQIVYSTAFGYRTDVANWNGKRPDDVCDFFDLAAFPGKRALEKRPINNMEWALLCAGVPKQDIYDVLATEAGQKRAFAKLDTIKEDVLWWSAGAEPVQLLADSEVVFASAYNGRLFALIEEQGQPVATLWDAQVFDVDGWIIPAGLSADRQKRAEDFIRFSTSTEVLAQMPKYIAYGPARASSAAMVGKHAELGIDMGPHMPTDPENAKNIFVFNYEWWADYRDDLDAKFHAWLVR